MMRICTRLLCWLLLLGLLACSSSTTDPQPGANSMDAYVYGYCPQLMTRTVLEESVAALPARAMHNTGKIYLWDHYIFVNELYEGLHVIDNQDPSHPQNIAFLRVPGNVDLAVRNHLLYVDNGPDLVTLDIRNPRAPQVISRVRDAFRELLPPQFGYVASACNANRPANMVVVGWQYVSYSPPTPSGGWGWINDDRMVFYSAANGAPTASAAAPTATGKSGSLARFAVLGSTLYAVDNQSLRLFDLSTPTTPVAKQPVQLPMGGVETIFPKNQYLFLGTQRGMYIFDATTPQAPKQVAYYEHVVSCDPVVVDDRYAYVTLRNGRSCGGGPNQLQVIDLTNISKPRLAQTYPMTGPQGLGVDGTLLFVCDSDGLKTFDTSQAPTLTMQQKFQVKVTDVIPHEGLLLAIGTDGLYQYSYAGASLRQLSFLPVTPQS